MQIHHNTIDIKHTSQIDGLSFRQFRGVEDFPKILAVIENSIEVDRIERVPTLEQIIDSYAHLENCNPQQDLIFAEIHGQVIGFLWGYWWKESNLGLRYSHIGLLAPNWRRKGIGIVLLEWMEHHLREIATAHPAETTKCFQATAFQFQSGTIGLLEQLGYQPIRTFAQMVRPTLDDIPDFVIPDGLSIRAALPEHYP